MSPSQQPTSINSNPIHLKNQFAHRFIRALNNLTTTTKSARRSSRVKIAANTAMASVVGSKRAWSRAVLWKIQNRSRNKGLILPSNRKRVDHKIMTNNWRHRAKAHVIKRRRNPNNPKREESDPFRDLGQASKLRNLVPGAQTMDSWCLMGETANYIKCLAAQVEVMRTLVDLYTTT